MKIDDMQALSSQEKKQAWQAVGWNLQVLKQQQLVLSYLMDKEYLEGEMAKPLPPHKMNDMRVEMTRVLRYLDKAKIDYEAIIEKVIAMSQKNEKAKPEESKASKSKKTKKEG